MKMKILTARVSRDIANQVNELDIKKENIASLIYRDGQFILFYYQ